MSRQMLNEKTFQHAGAIWRAAFLIVLAVVSAAYGWSSGNEQEFDGAVLQATFATFAVFTGRLFLDRSRVVKVTK
ncbi:MAG: hypothetical protein OEV60_10665 [Actinomycetota bacterium]|nr:hypothetical protein [Actinomycetota bacterium]MDH5224084.1 hypothetical protein [Actinomycetota bacterium]MDH5313844.1 hypothetical protein [Actinomycetota bacterium]